MQSSLLVLAAFQLSAASHPLAFLFGEWEGTAEIQNRDGSVLTLTQTERVGPMLGGDVVVIEGRGYAADGSLSFNAFAVASPTGTGQTWEMRSYHRGRAGTFPFQPKKNGFVWSTPAGPNARMRYTATIKGNEWHQVGEYIAPGQPPRKTLEMNLKRIGDTGWPDAGAPVPSRKK